MRCGYTQTGGDSSPYVVALTWRRLGFKPIRCTQVTFLYIYGHVRLHVCAELEDRIIPDKLLLIQYVCVVRFYYVRDINSFGAYVVSKLRFDAIFSYNKELGV